MSPRPSTFRQIDLERALKAAKKAGLEVGGFEIDASGKIVVLSAAAVGTKREPANAFDEWQANRNARPPQGH